MMPTNETECMLAYSLPRIFSACKNALANLGWLLVSEDQYRIKIKEPFKWGSTWPVQFSIEFFPINEELTKIILKGSIEGWGSIQSNHLKKQSNFLLETIKEELVMAIPIQIPISLPTPALQCYNCGSVNVVREQSLIAKGFSYIKNNITAVVIISIVLGPVSVFWIPILIGIGTIMIILGIVRALCGKEYGWHCNACNHIFKR